jgi:hypothetical protein
VVYQEYQTPKIRWRYGIEAWQEIEADNYTTNIVTDLSVNTTYQIVYRSYVITPDGQSPAWNTTDRVLSTTYQIDGVDDWWMLVDWPNNINPPRSYFTRYQPFARFAVKEANNNVTPNAAYRTAFFSLVYVSKGVTTTKNVLQTNGIWFVDLQATDPAKRKTKCVFKVFKNNNLIYQETRAVCPEVEKIPCKLSDVRHSIEIKKLPYLERVEVVPYQYSAYKLPGVPAPIVQADKIPAECLNIYNNAIYVIPPSGQGIYPNATPFDSFVAQICSAPGCPPPEYNVICDCQCQTCPGDTCPIECGNHICCYNDYGISVQSIPKSDYCGGTT